MQRLAGINAAERLWRQCRLTWLASVQESLAVVSAGEPGVAAAEYGQRPHGLVPVVIITSGRAGGTPLCCHRTPGWSPRRETPGKGRDHLCRPFAPAWQSGHRSTQANTRKSPTFCFGGACRNKHYALSSAESKHLSIINGWPVDPWKANLFFLHCASELSWSGLSKANLIQCALEIPNRILSQVLGQKPTFSDHQTLPSTAQQAVLGARLNFQANPHPEGGLVLSE